MKTGIKLSRRDFLVGAVAATAGGVAAACVAPGAAPQQLVATAAPEATKAAAPAAQGAAEELYGMVVFLKGSEFFNWCYKGMLDAAARLGPHVKVELQGPAEWDASLEAKAISELVAKGATGILATCGDAKAMNSDIDKAMAAGVPVITFDSDSDGSQRLCYCGTASYAAGQAAGVAMQRWLGQSGKVAISFFPGPLHIAQRVQGFKDALKALSPAITTIDVNDGGQAETAEAAITAALQANPDVTGIFCAHGNPGIGAASAVRATNMVGKVTLLTFDYSAPIIELMEKGEIKGTVGQKPYMMGYNGLLLAYGAAKKGSVDAFNNGELGPCITADIDTGVAILDKEMVQVYKTPPKL